MPEGKILSVTIANSLGLDVHVSGWLLGAILGLALVLVVYRVFSKPRFKRMEIDAAEFGLGNQKVTVRPNTTDLQIAYQIWIEPSTRKIGLPIDPEHDVIAEVYDSWYGFFSVTRELLKGIPATRFQRDDTARIINLSIDLLNNGVRPHLTRWHARFRKWYDRELNTDENADADPQDIQQEFPHYAELRDDMLAVNKRLIAYRQMLRELIIGR